MLNRAIIIGRVGQEPKVFEAKSGKIVSFSVATDSGWGEKKTTIWENVKVFGKLADVCATYVKKGMLVYVEGKRETSLGKDEKVYQEVNASEVKFLSKVEGEAQAKPAPARRAAPKAEPEFDDDLPV